MYENFNFDTTGVGTLCTIRYTGKKQGENVNMYSLHLEKAQSL